MLQKLVELPDLIRWTLIVVLSILLLYFGFKRENKLVILEKGIVTFINRYPKPTVARFEKTEMKGTFGIKLPAKLQSAIFFSLIYLLLATLLLLLYSKSVFIGKLIALMYSIYMIICFLLLKMGDCGVDYRLSTGLSHYLEDLFLSPFLILAIAALIKAFRLSESTTSKVYNSIN
ncbi:MAG: hypothetical protein IPP46_17805 [Bacteroidetes bacterium]|nr:hypothetical protein [Bacteroidota bacterium]